jgi:hypothetical protein
VLNTSAKPKLRSFANVRRDTSEAKHTADDILLLSHLNPDWARWSESFPRLTAYLDGLQWLGSPIVLMKSKPLGRRQPGTAKPFLYRTARSRVRRAARAAGLRDDLTLASQGGMTELGDAELTEQGIIAPSGHGTADAARGYFERTEAQKHAALMKRRAWISATRAELDVDESRNSPPAEE